MKKAYRVILIIALIIIVCAITFYFIRNIYCFGCGGDDEYGCSKIGDYSNAIKNNDLVGCYSFESTKGRSMAGEYDNICRERCISHVAFYTKNISACSLISPAKNISFATKGQTLRDGCYMSLAKNLSQPSLCNVINETNWGRLYCFQSNPDPANCIKEGQLWFDSSIDQFRGTSCCEGLRPIESNGNSVCSKCENHICESWENKNNCPGDCQ